MGALASTLTEYSNSGDSATFFLPGHDVVKPMLVLEKRRVPTGSQTMAEFTATVVYGVNDSEGATHSQKISLGAFGKFPIDADPTDLAAEKAAALVILRDIVQSDEFEAALDSFQWVQS